MPVHRIFALGRIDFSLPMDAKYEVKKSEHYVHSDTFIHTHTRTPNVLSFDLNSIENGIFFPRNEKNTHIFALIIPIT